jgi:hypothetical protein
MLTRTSAHRDRRPVHFAPYQLTPPRQGRLFCVPGDPARRTAAHCFSSLRAVIGAARAHIRTERRVHGGKVQKNSGAARRLRAALSASYTSRQR